jgi:cysteine synthase
MVPEIFDQSFPDRTLEVATEDAQAMVKRFAKDGLLIGPSSGAALAASMKLIQEVGSGTFVTILPDSGERYLSERFWEDQ